jgi:hypothetical protein
MVANTIFGFGLAHVVLGVIDLVEHRRKVLNSFNEGVPKVFAFVALYLFRCKSFL